MNLVIFIYPENELDSLEYRLVLHSIFSSKADGVSWCDEGKEKKKQ
jgi:hypothetical protein